MNTVFSKECDLTESDFQDEMKRVRKSVYKADKHRKGFLSSEALANWWITKLKAQNGCCDYCKTPILLIKKLIDEKLLAGRNVRSGIRGPRLELERMDHAVEYMPTNCVLICYYCNNDKSNVYQKEEYVEFLAPAKHRHFMSLLEKLALKEKKAA